MWTKEMVEDFFNEDYDDSEPCIIYLKGHKDWSKVEWWDNKGRQQEYNYIEPNEIRVEECTQWIFRENYLVLDEVTVRKYEEYNSILRTTIPYSLIMYISQLTYEENPDYEPITLEDIKSREI